MSARAQDIEKKTKFIKKNDSAHIIDDDENLKIGMD